MFVIQSTGIYNGSYHILGGTLPAFESKNSENGLLINSLINRVKKNSEISNALLEIVKSSYADKNSDYTQNCTSRCIVGSIDTFKLNVESSKITSYVKTCIVEFKDL